MRCSLYVFDSKLFIHNRWPFFRLKHSSEIFAVLLSQLVTKIRSFQATGELVPVPASVTCQFGSFHWVGKLASATTPGRWGHGIGPSPIGPSIDPHKVKAIKTTTPQSKCFASKSPSDRTRLKNLLVVNLACFGVQRKSGDLNLTSVDCVISLALRCKGPLWPNCLH